MPTKLADRAEWIWWVCCVKGEPINSYSHRCRGFAVKLLSILANRQLLSVRGTNGKTSRNKLWFKCLENKAETDFHFGQKAKSAFSRNKVSIFHLFFLQLVRRGAKSRRGWLSTIRPHSTIRRMSSLRAAGHSTWRICTQKLRRASRYYSRKVRHIQWVFAINVKIKADDYSLWW